MKRYICRKCSREAEVKPQPALLPTQQAAEIVTCWTRMCGNYGLTKSTKDAADISALFIMIDPDEADADDMHIFLLERKVTALLRLEGN